MSKRDQAKWAPRPDPAANIAAGKQRTLNDIFGVPRKEINVTIFDPADFKEFVIMIFAEEFTLLRYIISIPLGQSLKKKTKWKTIKFDQRYKNTLGKRSDANLRSKAESLAKLSKDVLMNKYEIEEKLHEKNHMLRKKH